MLKKVRRMSLTMITKHAEGGHPKRRHMKFEYCLHCGTRTRSSQLRRGLCRKCSGWAEVQRANAAAIAFLRGEGL